MNKSQIIKHNAKILASVQSNNDLMTMFIKIVILARIWAIAKGNDRCIIEQIAADYLGWGINV